MFYIETLGTITGLPCVHHTYNIQTIVQHLITCFLSLISTLKIQSEPLDNRKQTWMSVWSSHCLFRCEACQSVVRINDSVIDLSST